MVLWVHRVSTRNGTSIGSSVFVELTVVKDRQADRSRGVVSTWMGDRLRADIPSRYVTSQLGQLSLASLRVA